MKVLIVFDWLRLAADIVSFSAHRWERRVVVARRVGIFDSALAVLAEEATRIVE